MKKLLYQTNSLEKWLIVKKKLQDDGIEYFEKRKSNGKTGLFLLQLFISSMATYGLYGEHESDYIIYVKEEDFERAKESIMKGI